MSTDQEHAEFLQLAQKTSIELAAIRKQGEHTQTRVNQLIALVVGDLSDPSASSILSRLNVQETTLRHITQTRKYWAGIAVGIVSTLIAGILTAVVVYAILHRGTLAEETNPGAAKASHVACDVARKSISQSPATTISRPGSALVRRSCS